MKKDPKIYLIDIVQAIADIYTFSPGMTKEDFITNILLQDGILRKISVIGEAVKRLPPRLKEKEKDIPWKKITGMRDVVVHDYSDINLDTIWETVTEDLPKLNNAVHRMLMRV